MQEQLLSISKFAKIAGTTRRTLIFYDHKGIFKPVQIAKNGYRFYSYDQIYQISFILGLRDLGLSVDEIRDYLNNTSSEILNQKLNILKNKVEKKINDLKQVLTILNQRTVNNAQLFNDEFYQAKLIYLPLREFWCSDSKVDCSEEEIAQTFSRFYQKLGTGVMVNDMVSGFLTELPQAAANQYANASFRIIKERSFSESVSVPVISQNAGKYIAVKVKNTGVGIEKGLTRIRDFISEHHLKIGNDLWQFNLDNNIKKQGLADSSILAYEVFSG